VAGERHASGRQTLTKSDGTPPPLRIVSQLPST